MVVCIDTNVVMGMFGRTAPWLRLRHGLLAGEFVWALSNEILLEYEEIAAREMGAAHGAQIGLFIDLARQSRGSIQLITPEFRFQTIPPRRGRRQIRRLRHLCTRGFCHHPRQALPAHERLRLQATADHPRGVHQSLLEAPRHALAGCESCGAVRHPDHATIVLHDWCRVLMNEENKAQGRKKLAFLD